MAKCFYQTIFSAAGAGADWALNCFDTEGDEDDNNIHNLTLPTSTAAKYLLLLSDVLQYNCRKVKSWFLAPSGALGVAVSVFFIFQAQISLLSSLNLSLKLKFPLKLYLKLSSSDSIALNLRAYSYQKDTWLKTCVQNFYIYCIVFI